jgi:hypothetical protein
MLRGSFAVVAAATLSIFLSACGSGNDNDPPIANAVSLAVSEDTATQGTFAGSDPDGDPLTAALATQPSRGDVTLSAGNPLQFTYTPQPDQNGADTFTYTVSDGRRTSSPAAVTITIAPVNDAPRIAQSFTTDEDSATSPQLVTESDGETFTLQITSGPANGALTVDPATAGRVTYTPAANFNGTDSFVARATDAQSTVTERTVQITVQSVNDAPVAVDDAVVLTSASSSLIEVTANDVDVDGDALQLEVSVQAPGAAATIEGGRVRVTPAAGAAGPTLLTYQVRDPAGAAATASVKIIIDSMQPLFFMTDEAAPGQLRIYRYDYFTRTAIDTPVPAGERMGGFRTDPRARRLVYVTTREVPAVIHRLWVKDLIDPSAPVQELVTGGNFFTRWLEISPDGNHVAFNDRYANLSRPDLPVTIALGVERPRFTQDSQHLFYVVLHNGGGRTIHRAQIDPNLGPTAHTQVTASYQVAEGLGIGYTLTPDDSQVVSTGLFLIPPFSGPKQLAYVSPASGPTNDVRLHPAFSNVVDHASQPFVTADSRYAYYEATIGGVSGIYATDLQAPGIAMRVDVSPGGFFPIGPKAAADSRTLFYTLVAFPVVNWFHSNIDQPGVATPFTPLGPAVVPRSLLAAPIGADVVFSVIDGGIYATRAPYTSALMLLDPLSSTPDVEIQYAPDSNALAVKRTTLPAYRLHVVNPKIPGWVDVLVPGNTATQVGCFVFPGERC